VNRAALNLGLYVVTSAGLWPGRGHRDLALAAIEGGATAVQLRAPELESDHPAAIRLAAELAARCCRAGVLFVVNDWIDVAVESGADGVHVGQSDGPERARDRLGPDRVLGVSVEDPGQAHVAEAAGADYLAVTVWATATKPEARPIGLDGLRAIVGATDLPVVGIGGIKPGNAGDVLAAGAAGVAVVSAVGAAEDAVAATRDLASAAATATAHRRAGSPKR
jgi:thiamine-phosphate pyrophosphorylase